MIMIVFQGFSRDSRLLQCFSRWWFSSVLICFDGFQNVSQFPNVSYNAFLAGSLKRFMAVQGFPHSCTASADLKAF